MGRGGRNPFEERSHILVGFWSITNCDGQTFAEAFYNKGLALNPLGREKEAEVAFAKARALGYTGKSPAPLFFELA